MMNTNCPHCGSSQTRSRDVVYKTGTSISRSSGGFAGIGFGRGRRTSFWLGKSWRSGKRQTLLAQDAEPLSIVAPIPLIIFAFLFGGEMFGFFLIVGWLLIAIGSSWNYEDEWICKKCGTKFIPLSPAANSITSIAMNNNQPVISAEVPTSATVKDAADTNPSSGKSCSICGHWFPSAEFDYGKKENRSYCRGCNKEERSAYALGGVEAAREYRSRKRATWVKS